MDGERVRRYNVQHPLRFRQHADAIFSQALKMAIKGAVQCNIQQTGFKHRLGSKGQKGVHMRCEPLAFMIYDLAVYPQLKIPRS